ncbi:MAG: hypothetical protein RL266_1504 [Bacteroidota bacterium]
MTFYRSVFAFVCVFLAIETQAQNLAHFDWLVGEWTIEQEQTTLESWTMVNDSLLTGYSITTENGEEVFRESLSIEKIGSMIYYKAILPFKTAVFTLDSTSHNYFSFVDPENDFPSRIEYRGLNDSLIISLSGTGNKMVMPFVKK